MKKTQNSNKPKCLVIDFADFAIAAILFESVFVESLHHGSDPDLETRAAVDRLSKRGSRSVSATELGKELGISRHQAYMKLRRALETGLIYRANKPERSNRKYFLPSARPRFLPKPEDLFQRLPELGKEMKFVHPLTGEWVICRKKNVKPSH